tara:strand:+ start:961 stop:1515 length:555 start_codon:yes stop_codon:yes gene_type:complete
MSNNLEYKQIYDINNYLIYEGEIKNNLYHGNGKTYYKNGNINFDGVFFNGESTGNGIKYYENGSILYKSANSNINDSVIFDKNNDINLVSKALDSIIFDEEPDLDLLNNNIEDMFNECENNHNANKYNTNKYNEEIEEDDLNIPLIKKNKIEIKENKDNFINNICIYLKDKISDLFRSLVNIFR